MFAFVVFVSVFSTYWLGRTYPKWPTLCRVGRKSTTQSINQSVFHLSCIVHYCPCLLISMLSLPCHSCDFIRQYPVLYCWHVLSERPVAAAVICV